MSHTSPRGPLTWLSPQKGMVQSLSQALVLPVVPLSHCSPAVEFTMPSPHLRSMQLLLQLADSPRSSHCSPAVRLRTPSPQMRSVQLALQVKDSPASSHCSSGSRTPLPQPSPDRQSELQPSPLTRLPSSQNSPTEMSLMPLPHVSLDLQSELQPSVLTLLPSSQTSPLTVSL